MVVEALQLQVYRGLGGWPQVLNIRLGTRQMFGITYQPRGQNLVERIRMPLNNAFKAFAAGHLEQWQV